MRKVIHKGETQEFKAGYLQSHLIFLNEWYGPISEKNAVDIGNGYVRLTFPETYWLKKSRAKDDTLTPVKW